MLFCLKRCVLGRLARLLLSGSENALFTAADPLVRVKSFKNEFGRRNLLFRGSFCDTPARRASPSGPESLQIFERLTRRTESDS